MESALHRSKTIMLLSLIVLLLGIVLLPFSTVEAESDEEGERNIYDLEWDYSLTIVLGVSRTIHKESKEELSVYDYNKIINAMPKVEVMNKYLDYYGEEISGPEIRRVVNEIFDIDLDAVSEEGHGKLTSMYPEEIMQGVRKEIKDNDDYEDYLENYFEDNELNEDNDNEEETESIEKLNNFIMTLSKVEVMDLYLNYYGEEISSNEIQRVINDIFGVNLPGISSLEFIRVSLFSKGKWISQYERDLFVVYTNKNDIDVYIYPTEYFKEKTGLTELPAELVDKLKALGFYFNEEIGHYYYEETSGGSVPASFKTKTMSAIAEVVMKYYKEL